MKQFITSIREKTGKHSITGSDFTGNLDFVVFSKQGTACSDPEYSGREIAPRGFGAAPTGGLKTILTLSEY